MIKQAYHHGNLREAMLHSARAIMDEAGVEGLSLRKVAQHTGVSATALYSHFKDKRELLAVLATGGFEQLTDRMNQEAAHAATGHTEPTPKLTGLALGYVLFAIENRALFQLMFGREVGDLLAFPQLVAAGHQAYELMAHCVADALADSDSPGQTAIAAAAAWSMVHGLSMLIIDGRITAGDYDASTTAELVERVCGTLNFNI